MVDLTKDQIETLMEHEYRSHLVERLVLALSEAGREDIGDELDQVMIDIALRVFEFTLPPEEDGEKSNDLIGKAHLSQERFKSVLGEAAKVLAENFPYNDINNLLLQMSIEVLDVPFTNKIDVPVQRPKF